MHKIQIWNWMESNPVIKELSVTTEELQKWKDISDYDKDHDTYVTTDKAWCEIK